MAAPTGLLNSTLRADIVLRGMPTHDGHCPEESHWRGVVFSFLLLLAVIAWAVWKHMEHVDRHQTLKREAAVASALQPLQGEQVREILEEAKGEEMPSWMLFPDVDRADWVNAVVQQLWPHAIKAIQDLVFEQLDPLLKQNKPKWISDIHLHRFEMGDQPPQLSGVKVYQSNRVRDAVVTEMDVLWAGEQDIQLKIVPLPKELPLAGVTSAAVLKYLRELVFLQAGVSDVSFRGRVRITLPDLTDRIPIVNTAQISLVEMPHFSFALTLYGGNLMVVPGLEGWIQYFIKNILLEPYVLPEAVTVPLVPNPRAGRDRPAGVLFVRLLEATDVPKLDWFSAVDPYVLIWVRARKKKKSSVQHRTQHPVWNEEYSFLVHYPDHQEMCVDMKDWDWVRKEHTDIGKACIPIHLLHPGQTHDLWLSLVRGDNGRVRIENKAPAADNNNATDLCTIDDGPAADDESDDEDRPPSSLQDFLKRQDKKAQQQLEAERASSFFRRHHKPPRLHLDVTYFQVGEPEVEEATGQAVGRTAESVMAANPGAVPRSTSHREAVMNTLRGGVLEVIVHQPPLNRRRRRNVIHARQIVVRFNGKVRMTAAAKGKDRDAADDDEAFDYLIKGDLAEREDAKVEVEVWDFHWVNWCPNLNLTWGPVNGKYEFPREQHITIMLRDVIQEKTVRRTWTIDLPGNKKGEVDLELKWLGILD